MGIVSAKNAYNSSEVLRIDARKAKVNTHYDQVARSNDGDIAFVSKEGREFIEAFPQRLFQYMPVILLLFHHFSSARSKAMLIPSETV